MGMQQHFGKENTASDFHLQGLRFFSHFFLTFFSSPYSQKHLPGQHTAWRKGWWGEQLNCRGPLPDPRQRGKKIGLCRSLQPASGLQHRGRELWCSWNLQQLLARLRVLAGSRPWILHRGERGFLIIFIWYVWSFFFLFLT